MTARAEATHPAGAGWWLPPCYLGWLTVATAFAWARPWLERAEHDVVARAYLVHLLAALLCAGCTAPWLKRPSGGTPSTVSPGPSASSWRSIIAVALAMAAALTLLGNGEVGALVAALQQAPVAVLFSVPMLAFAEEVYFREALPTGLAAVLGIGGWRRFCVASGSQFLYAVAHLPALLLTTAPLLATAVLASTLREILFGVLLLTLARGPSLRIERTIIHSSVNWSIMVMPLGFGMQGWRGPFMCLLGGIALHLARWRAVPPPDLTRSP